MGTALQKDGRGPFVVQAGLRDAPITHIAFQGSFK